MASIQITYKGKQGNFRVPDKLIDLVFIAISIGEGCALTLETGFECPKLLYTDDTKVICSQLMTLKNKVDRTSATKPLNYQGFKK